MQKDIIPKQLRSEQFDPDSLKVYRRLRESGYTSYFVGGCIRDLLLGQTPKDFDIVTSARPEEIHRLFRNSRIIGRRFLIVNIFFGKKNIEVSTFRQSPWKKGIPKGKKITLPNDNRFGNEEQDALRRDFTINALLYDFNNQVIVDYIHGFHDLKNKLIRSIGDPETRFNEDPVRIIRALKFQTILGMDIESLTKLAISKCTPKVQQIPSARLLLEMEKILRSGHAKSCFATLYSSSIFSLVSPDIHNLWHKGRQISGQLFQDMLTRLDNKANSLGRAVWSDAVLLSPIYLPILLFSSKGNEKVTLPNLQHYCIQKLRRFVQNFGMAHGFLETISRIFQIILFLDSPMELWPKHRKVFQLDTFPQAWEVFCLYSTDDAKKQKIFQMMQEVRSKATNQ